MKNQNEEIKKKLTEMLESGMIKGHFEGPKDNVLICDSMNDWCLAGGEMVRSGFNVASPGGFGGSHHVARQVTHSKIWKTGTLCAISYNRKIHFFFGLLSENEEYQYCVEDFMKD